MELNIDPAFSVYKLVGRVQSDTAHLNHRRTMNVISNEIENSTLQDGARTRIFAAFQRYSRFLPQMERYINIAKRAESVYVFGVPDVELPPIENITYIPLNPTDQLAREWFLVSYGPEYASALATEEQTNITYEDSDRLFKGIWTFDPMLTSILSDWLSRSVNVEPLSLPDDKPDRMRHSQLIHHISTRMMRRLSAPSTLNGHVAMVRAELRGIVKQVLQPFVSQEMARQIEAL
jgi:DICT domain-containing protein